VSGLTDTPWSVQFRRDRQAAWTELERIVATAERHGLRKLTPESLARLPVLYRAASSALGVARSSVLDRNLVEHLEALVVRAYLVVHAPQRSARAVIGPFLLRSFPVAVRSIRWQVAVAAGLLGIGIALAWAMVDADPEQFFLFVADELANGRDPSASTEFLRETLFSGEDGSLLTFVSMLFTHNSGVSILCYGLGVVLGLPVILLMFLNGSILGAMSALFHQRGLAVEWWSWVLPHGVTELLAICLAGGAGLAVGQTIVFPGERTRRDALAAIGRRTGLVVAGSVVMLLLAAFVEGVFRQIVQSIPLRYGLATLFAGLWLCYFTLAGRGRKA
jgi:uncharacterized membrane protein SpoIIM required for sporulation